MLGSTDALPLLLPGPQQARSCCWTTPRWRTTRPWWLLVGQLSLSEKYPWLLRRRVEPQKKPDDSFDDDTWHCCGVLHYHLCTLRKSNTFTKPENRKLFVGICITSPTSSSKRRFRECEFVNIPLMMRQNITLFSYISRQEPPLPVLSFCTRGCEAG